MNHPTHPEEQTFAGLVMGREATYADEDRAAVARLQPYWSPVASTAPLDWPFCSDAAIARRIAKHAAPEPVPARTLEQIDAHHAKLMAALDAKDAEIARLTAAGPVAAQPATSNLALQELTTLIRHHTDPEAFQEIRQALLTFNQTAQSAQPAFRDHRGEIVDVLCDEAFGMAPAVPVTDAEARLANKAYYGGSICGEDAMRSALEAFLAARWQA